MRQLQKDSVLCLVPLPPPVTGAAYASEVVVNHLRQDFSVIALEYQRGNLISGKFSIRQVFKILSVGIQVIKLRFRNVPFIAVYYVISSSFWGVVRDLFLLALLGTELRRKTVLHLHTSNLEQTLDSLSPWLKWLARVLYSDVKYAIVLGQHFRSCFVGYVPDSRVKAVPNFFDPSLLIDESLLESKFRSNGITNFLYFSNLIDEKGYLDVLDAFLSMPLIQRDKSRLDIVGAMHPKTDRDGFLNRIAKYNNIVYHGTLTGNKKVEMFYNSHIFALPTKYLFEGQPITILEAYAAGCVVVTTLNGGISDIFQDKINGIAIHFDINSGHIVLEQNQLTKVFSLLTDNISKYYKVAVNNRTRALSNFSRSKFESTIRKLVTDA